MRNVYGKDGDIPNPRSHHVELMTARVKAYLGEGEGLVKQEGAAAPTVRSVIPQAGIPLDLKVVSRSQPCLRDGSYRRGVPDKEVAKVCFVGNSAATIPLQDPRHYWRSHLTWWIIGELLVERRRWTAFGLVKLES